jgi:hypothetical protein
MFYKALSDTVGLNEVGMRLPAFLTGISMPLVVPRLWRRYIGRNAYLFFVVLLSVSPLLVYFSRTARPYALTVLLASVALAACFRWWHEPGPRWAAVYLSSTVTGAYLHVASLLFTFMPVAFFGLLALRSAVGGDARPVRRLTALGLWALFLLTIVIGPPLYVDHANFLAKSGMQSLRWHALIGAVRLWAGSGNHFLIAVLFVLGAVGVGCLWHRQRLWLQYCLFCAAGLLAIVALSRGVGLDEAIVLARYGLPVVPVFLMLVACGLGHGVSRWASSSGRYVAAGMLVPVLLLAGPLRAQAYYPNQFTGHMLFQSDYRLEANPYRFLQPERIPEFYWMLGEQPPASLTIIEAPWDLAWHHIRLNFYQKVHRQRVRIGFLGALCGSDWHGFTGEYPLEATGMKFRNFVHLERVLQAGAREGDYVVFHSRSPSSGQQADTITRCIDVFAEQVGESFYEDDEIVVFAVAGSTRAGGTETR